MLQYIVQGSHHINLKLLRPCAGSDTDISHYKQYFLINSRPVFRDRFLLAYNLWYWNSCWVGSALSYPSQKVPVQIRKRSLNWGPRSLQKECAHHNGCRDKHTQLSPSLHFLTLYARSYVSRAKARITLIWNFFNPNTSFSDPLGMMMVAKVSITLLWNFSARIQIPTHFKYFFNHLQCKSILLIILTPIETFFSWCFLRTAIKHFTTDASIILKDNDVKNHTKYVGKFTK